MPGRLGGAGLVLGAAGFALLLAAPPLPGLSAEGQRALAAAVLMAVWWISEAVPIYATALLPWVLFPLLGLGGPGELARAYGHHLIFLFLGGFLLAAALQRWGVHEHLALAVLARLGAAPRRLVLGVMLATALLSMWISDTAATLVMLPLALGLVAELEGQGRLPEGLAPCLMLGVAYAALIGGMATLVGTPPNLVFAGMMERLFPEAPPIGFLDWMLVGLPASALFLPLAWLYLTRVAFRLPGRPPAGGEGAAALLARRRQALGPMAPGARRAALVFALTALAWVSRRGLDLGPVHWPGWQGLLGLKEVGDATVAVAGALLLFLLPAGGGRRRALLSWEEAAGIPWGVLLLFGGGLALADAVRASGLAAWLAHALEPLAGLHPLLMVLAVCLAMTFLTELTSNTAVTTVFLPVLAAAAVAGGMDPRLLMVPAALSASCAFMLPVATPPNAIAFASGRIRARQMARVGLGLNLIGVAVIASCVYLVGVPALGLALHHPPPWAAGP